MPKSWSSRLLALALLLPLAAGALGGCASTDWPAYRFDVFREGNQRAATPLSDPTKVPTLAVRWAFPSTGAEGGSFLSSPTIISGNVYIGSTSGRFYALNAATGAQLWQYPPAGQPPLLGSCTAGGTFQTYGAYGIMSSAAYFEGLVIFGAPDPTAESGLGSARLFALNASTGALAWSSDVVAHVSGCTPSSTSELHERIAYSAPLVVGRAVYVSVHNAGDDPIQNGKVLAVDIDTGHLVPGFSFAATSTRGGGMWNGPASDLSNIYVTTGNTRCWNGGCQSQPTPNYGLSMLKLNGNTGAVQWQFQPVPYDLDNDPDWAAGAALQLASCGTLATSVQKDGWAYALDANTGQCRWQFPPTAEATSCQFPSGGPNDHGDTDYKRPPATWGDVQFVVAGGESLVSDGPTAGYGRLHALNVCAGDSQRVRWLLDVPHASLGNGYSLGAPTVTGGIVYVGTDQGHVVAIADPAIVPTNNSRCSNIDFPNPADCLAAGYTKVWIPTVLADVALPDGSSAAGLRNEPAIASGQLFIATEGGHVYMLSP